MIQINPERENWKDVDCRKEEMLQGGYREAVICLQVISRMHLFKIYQYDYNGKQIREIKLPGIGTAEVLTLKKEDKEFFYSIHPLHTTLHLSIMILLPANQLYKKRPSLK